MGLMKESTWLDEKDHPYTTRQKNLFSVINDMSEYIDSDSIISFKGSCYKEVGKNKNIASIQKITKLRKLKKNVVKHTKLHNKVKRSFF